jgi:phosphopantothenoylcysteine decarboxylase / phosphopantothenate---cysteine ligase
VKTQNVLLAVTGSIAAYKAALLASELVQEGLAVRVILTHGGSRFINSVTFEGITGLAVASDLWSTANGTSPMEHLELASWADVLVVAPAAADAIARLAQGRSDDLLGASALAFRGPVLIAPAMESNMFSHPATTANIDLLRQRGATVIGPESGRLASGSFGPGRMSEPPEIARAVREILQPAESMAGRKVLVTAGPTYEPIDPVRFIGNRSSGKMGYAVASEAQRRGAEVVLVSGPTNLARPAGMRVVDVETSDEMRTAVLQRAPKQDALVMCAAVADYKPVAPAGEKLKRGTIQQIEVMSTDDIAAEASRLAPDTVHVGFALESGPLVDAARNKLRRKGQALVVANGITADHNPFGSDINQVVFVTETGEQAFPPASKGEVARRLWDEVEKLLPPIRTRGRS